LIIMPLIGVLGALAVARIARESYLTVVDDFEPFPPSNALQHPELAGIADLASVNFRSADGDNISGWYAPSRNRAAVVITHGTNADRTTMLPVARIIATAGYGVLLFDWPGNGASSGSVHWAAGERHALTAAIGWLSTRSDVDPSRIGGYGFSMGGYLLAQVAATEPRLRASVLAAAPASFVEYTRVNHDRWGFVSEWPAVWSLRMVGKQDDALAPITLVDRIAPRAVLVLGGSEDPYIPPSMTRALYDHAHEPKSLWIVPGAEHGDYLDAQPVEFPQRLTDFLSRTLLN
jgi:uncharacterized protein